MLLNIAIEKIIGSCYLIIGLSMILQTKAWIRFVEFLQQPGHTFLLALVGLPIGFTIVTLHPAWSLSASSIVTALGWLMIIKFSGCLLCPKLTLQLMPRKALLKPLIFSNGIIMTLACVLVLLAAAS